jgi:hypothetical protein
LAEEVVLAVVVAPGPLGEEQVDVRESKNESLKFLIFKLSEIFDSVSQRNIIELRNPPKMNKKMN